MSLTFRNTASYIAQFVVHKGDQVLARLPGIAPGAELSVPTNVSYEVSASTVLEGNTYTTAPVAVSEEATILAQVIQVANQGTYEFQVVTLPGTTLNALTFQKTCVGPVMFTLSSDGRPLQTVVVENSFEGVTLSTSATYTAYAVVNGITTATVTTTNSNAVFTVMEDNEGGDQGYYSVVVS